MRSAWRSLCLMGHKQETTMSSITVQSATPAAFGGAVRWMMRWARALALYLDRRAAIKELGELDDRALRARKSGRWLRQAGYYAGLVSARGWFRFTQHPTPLIREVSCRISITDV